MNHSERIQKLKQQYITYPPYIETTHWSTTYEANNPIEYESIKDDLVQIYHYNGTRSPPTIYKNKTGTRYYCQYKYIGGSITNYVFDITDAFDWNALIINDEITTNINDELRKCNHYKRINHTQTKQHFPGSTEYDSEYPPIQTN
jgi:hypothetical protein